MPDFRAKLRKRLWLRGHAGLLSRTIGLEVSFRFKNEGYWLPYFSIILGPVYMAVWLDDVGW